MAAKYALVRQHSNSENPYCNSPGPFVESKFILKDISDVTDRTESRFDTFSKPTPSPSYNYIDRSYVLECVMKHAYDSIFPTFREKRSQHLMLELWALVPNEIEKSMRASNGTWTKYSLITAFKHAESSQNDFCENTLEIIINFRKDYTFRDLVIEYIEKQFQGYICVIETFGSVSSLPNAPLGSLDFPSGSYSSLRQIGPSTIQPNPCDINSQIERKRILFYTKCCLLAVAITVTVGAFSCYATYLFVTKTYKIDALQLTQDQDKNPALAGMINTKLIPPRQEKKPRYNITVKSYHEFNETMSKLQYDREVYLTIKVESERDWPINVPLGNTDTITMLKLEINLSGYQILAILEKMVNIKELELIGKISACGDSDKHNSRKIELPKLKYLSFSGFGECSNFYRLISKILIAKNIEMFQIGKGIITVSNLPSIQRILQGARSSLSALEFPETLWLTTVFNSALGTLENVKFLRVDFLDNKRTNAGYINRYVDNLLPNLERFSSASGFISWSQFLNMTDCKKLERISIGVEIPKVQKSIDLTTLRRFFPILKALDISFQFEDAGYERGCKINGIEEMEYWLDDFTYRSNCYDKMQFQRMQNLLMAVTESMEMQTY